MHVLESILPFFDMLNHVIVSNTKVIEEIKEKKNEWIYNVKKKNNTYVK